MIIQDASRKVQNTSQAPGPWAGTGTNNKGGVHGLVSKEIWDKTWRLIAELVVMEREERYRMFIARMESIIWFLVYVSRTYRDTTAYLKGVHLALESRRPYMDEEV